jgi:hypothetical protein
MLLQPELPGLQLDVVDITLGDTTILRQRARPTKVEIQFLDNGCRVVRLWFKRTQYGRNQDGSYGTQVPEAYANTADVLLVGDSSTAVDPQSQPVAGRPRYRLHSAGAPHLNLPGSAYNLATGQLEEFEPGQSWEQWLGAKPEPLMLQDRFFGVVCATEQVNINALVLDYAQQADSAPSSFA